MNERPLPEYSHKEIQNQYDTPIDPSVLNPDSFVDGIATIILEPTIITAQSGSGKASSNTVIIGEIAQDACHEGYENIYRIVPKASSESSEATSQAYQLRQTQLTKALGRTGSISL